MTRFVKKLHWTLLAASMLFPVAASGSSDLGLDGLGLMARIIEPENADATVGIGALVDLGGFSKSFRLEGRVDFWAKSENVSSGGKASVRDIAIGARGKYVFPVSNPQLRPFAGGGLGIHFLHAEVDIPEQNFGGFVVPASHSEDSATRIGLDVGGGLNYAFGAATSLVSELWFTIVDGGAEVSLGVGVLWSLGGSKSTAAQ